LGLLGVTEMSAEVSAGEVKLGVYAPRPGLALSHH